jgi:hypothetical protein
VRIVKEPGFVGEIQKIAGTQCHDYTILLHVMIIITTL